MKKSIGKIGAFVVLGLLILVSLSSPVSAVATLGEGDSKVEVVDTGDGYIYMEEDGTEYFRLTGGNIGIGVTNPAEKLEVDGDILLNSGADRDIYVETPSSASDGYDLDIKAGNAYATTNPQNGGDLKFYAGRGAGGVTPGYGGDVYIISGGSASAAYVGDIIIGHDGTTAYGNVGIGTTTPGAALDVGGGLGTLADGADDVLIKGDLEVDDDVQIDGGTITLSVDTNVALSGGVNGISFDGTTLSIDATNDNVGIGTTAPGHKLTVQQDITTDTFGNGQIRIQGASDTNQFLSFELDTNGNYGQIQTGDDSPGANLYYDLALNPSGGNVGIGTTSPSAYADLTLEGGVICLKEVSSTPTADTDYGKIYTKNNSNKLYFQDGDGTEHEIVFV